MAIFGNQRGRFQATGARRLILALWCGGCVALAVPVLAAEKMDVRTADVKARQGQVVLVDIRTPQEWAETGVPISGHAITMHQSAAGFLSALDKVTGGDKSNPIALICRTGNRSGNLVAELEKRGYTKIIDVSEGMAGSSSGPGWLKTGLPVRTGAQVSVAPVTKPLQ